MAKIHKLIEIANDDEEEDDDFLTLGEQDFHAGDDLDGLRAVARLARLVGGMTWFSAVGRPLTPGELRIAEDYVAGIGFAEARVAGVETWVAAIDAAQAPDFEDDWWQAEEQMRRALLDEALQFNDEHDLEVALQHVATRAGEVAHERAAKAAARHGVSDPALLQVAAGAASQAAYQAALVLAARSESSEPDVEHPFALKFKLFEMGRLPLGLVGSSFNLF
jgi:hypothetical protein